VVGYSQLTGETTSQSTKPPKGDDKVAGYNPAKALHSHSAKSPAEELLAGHPKDGDLSRWLTLGKSLVICVENSREIHIVY